MSFQRAFDPEKRPDAELEPKVLKRILNKAIPNKSRQNVYVINPPEEITETFHQLVENGKQNSTRIIALGP